MKLRQFLRYVWVTCMFPPQPKNYYVESDEPFSSKPVLRGPFTEANAYRLVGIQAGCGCINRVFRQVENSVLVRIS
jgi:hypothetical protein